MPLVAQDVNFSRKTAAIFACCINPSPDWFHGRHAPSWRAAFLDSDLPIGESIAFSRIRNTRATEGNADARLLEVNEGRERQTGF